MAKYKKAIIRDIPIETQEEMLIKYDKMIWKLAHQYAYHHDQLQDLYQEGAIALFEAVCKYDPERSGNCSLTTYVYFKIRSRLCTYLSSKSRLVKIGNSLQDKGNKMYTCRMIVKKTDTGEEYTDPEINNKMKTEPPLQCLSEDLEFAKSHLSDKHKYIIEHRYGWNKKSTLGQISKALGISTTQVQVEERKALKIMKQYLS